MSLGDKECLSEQSIFTRAFLSPHIGGNPIGGRSIRSTNELVNVESYIPEFSES